MQQGSLYAPSGIKIDGTLKEWRNPLLQAYNPINRTYYAISNDENNLYIAVRGFGGRVARKALEGGVTFSITQNDKKKLDSPENKSITFPTILDDKRIAAVLAVVSSLNDLVDDTLKNKLAIDTIVATANKQVASFVKELKVQNLTDEHNATISIYNDLGLKAMMGFIKRQPIIELAIPLKQLGLSYQNSSKFYYNIKFNARPRKTSENDEVIEDPDLLYVISPANFWGEYTLAKKP